MLAIYAFISLHQKDRNVLRQQMTPLETDVLVIGAGGAGMYAALEAARTRSVQPGALLLGATTQARGELGMDEDDLGDEGRRESRALSPCPRGACSSSRTPGKDGAIRPRAAQAAGFFSCGMRIGRLPGCNCHPAAEESQFSDIGPKRDENVSGWRKAVNSDRIRTQ